MERSSPVSDICRKAGISQATYFNWKKKYEGLQPREMRRLKQLEEAKLKKIVADLSLDHEMLQDRRAGGVLEFARSTYHDKSRRHEQAGLERLVDLGAPRPYFDRGISPST
jgi:hypothetical protein